MRYIVFDRTRHENFEKCCRLRLLTHEYPTGIADSFGNEIRGLDRQAIAIPLLTGGTVHKGLEHFAGHRNETEALMIAGQSYDDDIQARGLELDEQAAEPMWTARVQHLLSMALILGWVRKVWPKLEAEFDVVDIEQEERLEIQLDADTVIVLLTRSDLVMRRKSDGRHFVFNHKTINEPSEKKLQSLRYDTQSISEVLAAQARYDRTHLFPGTISRPTENDPEFITVDGVIYDLLIKGPRKVEYPKGSGVWHNASPLIWCYQKEGQTGITDNEIAARWEWSCTESHKMANGHKCEGHKEHRLGKGWFRKLVTEVFPSIEAWFDWLEENEPGLIEQQFQTLAPIMRTPYDVERWKRCVLTEEWGIAERADAARAAIQADGFNGAASTLDTLFPLHTAHGNCMWPSKCVMFTLCWGGPVDNPLELEGNDGRPLYAPRRANHPEAVEGEPENGVLGVD
jgi:hypothetical protein